MLCDIELVPNKRRTYALTFDFAHKETTMNEFEERELEEMSATPEMEDKYGPIITERMSDPEEKEIVRNLGKVIGYGNMMYLASECWRETLAEDGMAGGEFTLGPCAALAETDAEIAKRMWQQYKDDGYCYAWYTRAEGAIDFEDYLDQQGGE